MKNINNAFRSHLEVRSQFPVRDVATTMQQKRARCLQSRRSKARRNYYRQICYWFQPSNSLLKLERTMFRAKKSGDITCFNTLRRNYQQLLKHEKRQSLNSYLEETTQSKDIQKFYDLMKRLNPKFKWNVNTGSTREDSIATNKWKLKRSLHMQAYMNIWKHRKLNLKVRSVALIQVTSTSPSGTS